MHVRCPFPPGVPEERCVHEGIAYYGLEGLVSHPFSYEVLGETTHLIDATTMAHLRSEGFPMGTRFFDVLVRKG